MAETGKEQIKKRIRKAGAGKLKLSEDLPEARRAITKVRDEAYWNGEPIPPVPPIYTDVPLKSTILHSTTFADELVDVVPNDARGFFTLTQLADVLGIHRVTLKRMEDSGAIPKAKWRKEPTPHRVYTAADFKIIKEVVEKRRQKFKRTDVEYVE